MMREITPADRPALLAFLRRHEAQSMFPLVNLSSLSGVAMRAWVAEDGGKIAGMVGLTETGFVMPQWQDGDWTAAAVPLRGQRIGGLIGPAQQVQALKQALGLAAKELRHDREEPGFTLDLTALQMPEVTGRRLTPLTTADLDEVTLWRLAYNAETFGEPANGARDKAAAEVARWLKRGSHRLLWQDGRRVALTGFNAQLPEVVQIGGVFVPPALRRRGHARAAVALHLAEARAGGVRRAVLFAASAQAERAYRAIGFCPAGRMSLVFLHEPKVLP
jgi:N-acetylglutamate synthase-like GNAT family acetyltransferase